KMSVTKRDQRHGRIWECSTAPAGGSAELTVLAAAAVVAAELSPVAIGGILTGDAQPHAWNGLAPCLRDLRAAVGAMGEAGTLRQPALRAQDAVRHGRIDLLLYGAVTGPACCHGSILRQRRLRAYLGSGAPAAVRGRGRAQAGLASRR